MLFIAIVVICIWNAFVFVKGEDKRLLTDDPGYYGNILENLKREVETLKVKNAQLETQIRGGVAYVRWGRTSCDHEADIIYSGYMGGSYYNEKGSAAEYVCLPPNPQWGPKSNHTYTNTAHMYGSEYEDPILYGFKTTFENAPCALCFSSSHTNERMIPGRQDCVPGWTKAYNGYLSAGLNSHPAASQFICVDEQPEAVQGGNTVDSNGKLLYGVRTVCGSLPCPPYVNNMVLTCVVCLR